LSWLHYITLQYLQRTDDYRIGIVSEPIPGVSYRIVASEMTYIVSGGALNSTHSLTHSSYRLLLYRPILCASLQVQQLLTGCITQDDQRAVATHRRARTAFDRPQYGRGLKGREPECSLQHCSR